MNRESRKKIETFFSHLAGTFYKHRLKSLLACILVIAGLASFVPSTIIDTSAVALLRKSDPTRIQYDAFRDQFDENEMIIITITPDEIFSHRFLERMKAFHDELDHQVPHIKEITSLINARDTYGKGEQLVVGELLEDWPETASDLQALRERVLANPLYIDSLISNDGRVTTLLLETAAVIEAKVADDEVMAEFEDDKATAEIESPNPGKAAQPRYFSEKENRQVVEAINRVVQKYDHSDFSVALAGNPVVLDVYNRAMETDIVRVILLSLLTIAVFLALLFRRVSGVLLPEIVIVSALFSTAGLISLFNITIKLTTIVLPGFLLAVSVGYAVHILSIFYVQYQNGRNKMDAITYAVGHSGLAVVLTALTTAASLFSFAFAELTAITENGIKNPAFLNSVQAFKTEVLAFSSAHLFVGKVFAINDIIKEIHRSLFDNDPAYYIIPDKQNAISQELLLFENSGSDDIERFTDRRYRMARISIKTPWTDAVYLKDFIAHVETLLEKHFPDVKSRVITGIPALMSRSIPASLQSMAKSYLIAFVVITGLMIAHVGNAKIGLLSMISNLLPIFMTMGIMGAFNLKLDMSTIMIGSIAIGIVVDDTLHFMYNFTKYYDESGNAADAIEKTMLGTGRALLLTSMILSSGFFILMTASLSLLVVFGFLTGLTIIFALLADFVVNPALMVLVTGHKN